jgi:hypothetical protein
MFIVGTDAMTVQRGSGVPDGTRHAVDHDGRVLCRSSRPRFVWPALRWDHARTDDNVCRLCAQVHVSQEALSQVPSYPREPSVPSQALVRWQPSVGLFEPSDQ